MVVECNEAALAAAGNGSIGSRPALQGNLVDSRTTAVKVPEPRKLRSRVVLDLQDCMAEAVLLMRGCLFE